eukprot:TRINITY_DN2149_c0_g1_i3.p1 TRINITY_DN2149_c0_g1~~TRINITY_DN2149_c0_g1_i3.p1  ORF type:complete len:231 (+),score=12.52 TRINITY_DN2149_c0_g1_i3:410-1102(+)
MMSRYNMYGQAAQFGCLGGLAYFCLKTKTIKTKLFLGALYVYWISHLYTLGSHLGVYVNLKWAYDNISLDPKKYETGTVVFDLFKKVREREEIRNKGERGPTDSQLLESFYRERLGFDGEKIMKKSHIANDYFAKNREKYSHIIGKQDSNVPYEDTLRVPYVPEFMDCFLSRYIYHNFTRWCQRMALYTGIRKEQFCSCICTQARNTLQVAQVASKLDLHIHQSLLRVIS